MTTTSPLNDIAPGQIRQTELSLWEFLDLDPDAEEAPYLEYEGDGLVRRKMSPNPQHSEIQPHLARLFLNYSDRASTVRRLHVYTELRITTSGRSRLPDVAVYVGRRPLENDRKQAIDVADVSIEIVSPGDSRLQLSAKCQWYLDQGGASAMLIDPERREVSVLSKTAVDDLEEQYIENRYAAYAPDEVIDEFTELLPGLNLSPGVIFQVLDQ